MRPADRLAPTGRQIREAREAAGLTQRQAADMLGKSHQEYWRYEAGRTMPEPPQMARIAKAFGVRLEWLVTGEGPMRDTEAAE